jgi:hypothetical protein
MNKEIENFIYILRVIWQQLIKALWYFLEFKSYDTA